MGPIKLDINLKRGVWVTGRVIEEDTGKPVRARVEYYVFPDNPHQEGYPAFRETLPNYHYAGRDGAFQFVAFPGPGLLVADARGDEYIQGAGVDALKHKPRIQVPRDLSQWRRSLGTSCPRRDRPSAGHGVDEPGPPAATWPVLDRHRARARRQTPLWQSGRGVERLGLRLHLGEDASAGGIDLYDPRLETRQRTDREILEPEAQDWRANSSCAGTNPSRKQSPSSPGAC